MFELAIKIPERRHWGYSGVFTVNFERISRIVLMLLFLTLGSFVRNSLTLSLAFFII